MISKSLPMKFYQFQKSKDEKYYKNWTNEIVFVYILSFIFHCVSCAKPFLRNKYILYLCVWLIFWFMRKDYLNVHTFQNRNCWSPESDQWFFDWTLIVSGPFHRKDFKWKTILGYEVNFWKKALYAELNERVETATGSNSATGDFFKYIYFMLVAKNYQKIGSKCLVYEFSFTGIFNDINHGYRASIFKKNHMWLLPFYMAGATYCYYEKVRTTINTVTVSYLLRIFRSDISFSISRTFPKW